MGGRLALRASEALAASRHSSLGEHNHDVIMMQHDHIMIRLMSHHWHSASDSLSLAGSMRPQRASDARTASRQSFGELSRRNRDAIMIEL